MENGKIYVQAFGPFTHKDGSQWTRLRILGPDSETQSGLYLWGILAPKWADWLEQKEKMQEMGWMIEYHPEVIHEET